MRASPGGSCRPAGLPCVALILYDQHMARSEHKESRRDAPERDEQRLEVGASRLEEQDVDDDLRELRQVANHAQAPLNVLADLLDEKVVERLREARSAGAPSRVGHQPASLGRARPSQVSAPSTYLAQDVVDVAVVLGEPFRELVVLLGEGPDVDAAQRVGLREGEREREPWPAT